MKQIILLIAFCTISSCILAQDVDSLIEIKGYYVVRFEKQQIAFGYEQKLKEKRGESYSIPIDYESYPFFIPIQVGNNVVCKEDSVTENFLNYIRGESTYVVLHREHHIDFFKELNLSTIDISKEICIINNCWRISPYYEVEGNEEFLFKCVYIEGKILHKHVRDIEEKWRILVSQTFQGGTYYENGELFFIVKINNYTPYLEIPNLKIWLPYLDSDDEYSY